MAVYDIAKQEYEKKKADYRFAVKYYVKNKELLYIQKSVLNSILGEILRSLESVINEAEYLIKTVDEFCDDCKAANPDFNYVVNASKMTIENCTILIRETIKMIYSDDPMSLQGILSETKIGEIGILCNSNSILAKINNNKTTT